MLFQERSFREMEPKPQVFPFLLDPRLNQEWSLAGNQENFLNVFNEKIDETEVEKKALKKETAAVFSTLQMAMLQNGGFKNMEPFLLAAVNQKESKDNFEDIDAEDYVSTPKLLEVPLAASQQHVKMTKLDIKAYQEKLKGTIDKYGNTPGSKFNHPHNLNLHQGISDDNPFKKEDTKNREAFQKNPVFKLLTEQFMSPLRALGKDIWNYTQATMDNIQKSTPHIKKVKDPFTDNKIDYFDMYSNYASIRSTEELWSNWNKEAGFGFMVRSWSDMKGFFKTMRQFTGSVVSLSTSTSQTTATTKEPLLDRLKIQINTLNHHMENYQKDPQEDQLVIIQRLMKEIQKNKEILNKDMKVKLPDAFLTEMLNNQKEMRKQNISTQKTEELNLHHVKQWWNQVAVNMPRENMLLPFGFMAEAADHIMQTSTTYSEKFLEKMSTEHMAFLEEYVFKTFFSKPTFNIRDFQVESFEQAQETFKQLREIGVIDSHGTLQQHMQYMNIKRLPTLHQHKDVNEKLWGVIQNAYESKFNLSFHDKAIYKGKERDSITLQGPNGKNWTIDQLLHYLFEDNENTTQHERISEVYNILFDIAETMSGTSIYQKSKKDGPKIKEKNGEFLVEFYPKASWKEWNPNYKKIEQQGGDIKTDINDQDASHWKTVSNQPLTMSFSSKKHANFYYDSIRQVIAMLEPLIGTFQKEFSGKNAYYQQGEIVNGPLRVFVDNEGDLNKNGEIVQQNSSNYRFGVDHLFAPDYFKSKQWTEISTFLSDNVIKTISEAMFARSIMNRIKQSKHKRKHEEYREREQQFKEEEYWRLRDEMKKYHQNIAQKKREEKAHEKKVAARRTQLRLEGLKRDKKLQQLKRQKRKNELKAAAKTKNNKK